MKKTSKAAMVAILIALLMLVTSCNGLFTTSMAPKSAVRDTSKAAKALAKKDSADLAKDAANVGDKNEAQKVLGALSTKSKEEIIALSPEEKASIISASMTACIDMAALAGAIDVDELTSEDADPSEIIGEVLKTFSGADTTCVQYILEDSLNEDGTLKDMSEETKKNLALGAVSVAASAVSGTEDMDFDKLSDAMENGGDPKGILGLDATEDDVKALETSLKTLKALSDAGLSFEDLFAGFAG